MERIHIEASTSYKVIIEEQALHHIVQYIQPLKSPRPTIIVSDDQVAPLYITRIKEQLEMAGYTVYTYIFPHGETEKNAHRLLDLVEYMAQKALTRKDLLIALGGGVVGDLAGFAAATYLRGIDYIQIPTSLLAAVDSSVGGKTAVNLSAGKNLWGAFKQPILVLCDPTTIKTLPAEEFANGCGEIIKYGMLGYPELLQDLQTNPLQQDDLPHIEAVIALCVKAKANIVSQDEHESGLRALLNFGHTFGHSIEQLSHFAIKHGMAVSIGMALMMRAAYQQGAIDHTELTAFLQLLTNHKLPIHTEFTATDLCHVALHDKKSQGNTITIIRPTKWGSCELLTIPHADLPHYVVKEV
ncbi:3-dehydroquinate synthase [Veillonella criceti]|uniref:3-dehydroquinate synthase n=1 Tax=Veillonella criceti TaxID=103891 RepID=A0A380NLK9_9FIRM|nr:3-dehydroquinate synthase [Veillonella criceti]SUP44063.1 3-dehydroquinate synthase [Veillonella criceti]